MFSPIYPHDLAAIFTSGHNRIFSGGIPYSEMHETARFSKKTRLTRKKQHFRHPTKSAQQPKKIPKKRRRTPSPSSREHPDPPSFTKKRAIPCNKANRQTGKPADRQTGDDTYPATCRTKSGEKYQKRGKRQASQKRFAQKKNAALAKPRMGFSIGFSSFAEADHQVPAISL